MAHVRFYAGVALALFGLILFAGIAPLSSLNIVGSGDNIVLSASTYSVPAGVAYAIKGQVLNNQGAYIGDLVLYWKLSNGMSGQTYPTDALGSFSATIQPVSTGTYTLTVSEDANFCGARCGSAQAYAQYVVGSGNFYTLTISVQAGSNLVQGAIVSVGQNGISVGGGETGGAGSVAVTLPPGSYSVTAIYSGYQSATQSVSLSGNQQITITLQQAVATGTASFVFQDSGTKKPLSGVSVSIANTNFGGTTNSTGTLTFLMPVGSYTITYTPSGIYGSVPVSAAFTVQAGQHVYVTYSLPSSGGVFTFLSNGQKLSGVAVTITSINFTGTSGSDGTVSFFAAPGFYSFSYVPPPSSIGKPGSGSIAIVAGTTTFLTVNITSTVVTTNECTRSGAIGGVITYLYGPPTCPSNNPPASGGGQIIGLIAIVGGVALMVTDLPGRRRR